MREQRDAGDVADRPDVLGGAHPLVDLDAASGSMASPSESSPSRLGRRPVASEQAVERDPGVVGEHDVVTVDRRSPSHRAGCRRRPRAGPPATSAAASGVDARQEPVVRLDERDLRAHAREELRQLAADRPAAEHDQRRRYLGRLGRFDVRPVVDRRAPGWAGSPAWSRSRSRAGRTRARARRPRRRPAGSRRRHRERARSADRRATSPARSRPARRRGRATRRRPPGRASAGSSARRPPCLRDELGRPQHRLRRHAGPVGAFTADEASLDQRQLGVGVEPAEGADEMLAGRPSTENDDTHQAARGARWP